MKRIGLAAALIAAVPAMTFAADQAGQPVIAVVDLQKVVHNSEAGRSIDMQYDKQHQLFADRVAAQESDLDTREQALNRQRTVLTSDAFNSQREALETYSANVQKAIQQESQANQLAFNDAFAGLVKSVHDIIAAVAREKGVTVVLPQEQTLYLGESGIDITDTVLSRLDARLPSITVAVPKDEDAPPASREPGPRSAGAGGKDRGK